MRYLSVALLAVMSLFTVSLKAQTVDEIVNKYITALGGKEKVASVKTITTEYDMDIMGNTVSGTTWLVDGKGYKNELNFNGQKIVEVFTDKGGWTVNPMMGQSSPEAIPEDLLKLRKSQLEVGGPLYNYAAKGYAVALAGLDTLNGVKAFKLIAKKEGVVNTFWIDPTTYYILKNVFSAKVSGQDVETVVVFSNYNKIEAGFVVPGTAEITIPQGMTFTITNKKVELNKEVDTKIFEMKK